MKASHRMKHAIGSRKWLQWAGRAVQNAKLNVPQHGVVGSLQTTLDLSYLADTVMLLRFFEAEGRIRKALSIIKNRGGAHEDRIREYRIDTRGLRVGEPLTMFRGVLTQLWMENR